MTTIGIEGSFLATSKPDGIPRLAQRLVYEMVRSAPDYRFVILGPRVAWRSAAAELANQTNCTVVSYPISRPVERVAWRHSLLPLLAARYRVSVLLNPYGHGPVWMPPRVPLVPLIHDLSWLSRDAGYRARHRFTQRWTVTRAANLGAHVIANSHFSASQIYRNLLIPKERVSVVYPGRPDHLQPAPSDHRRMRQLLGIQENAPLVLFVGSALPRKNLLRAWSAFSLLRHRDCPSARLVVVGSRRSFSQDHDLSPLGSDPNTHLLGYIDDGILASLYDDARCLLFPSLEEGFGLPLLEAMAARTPIVTSEVSALPEVAGDAALLVDPRDTEDIYRALHSAVLDENVRRDLVEKGARRVMDFSWSTAATKMLDILSRVSAE